MLDMVALQKLVLYDDLVGIDIVAVTQDKTLIYPASGAQGRIEEGEHVGCTAAVDDSVKSARRKNCRQRNGMCRFLPPPSRMSVPPVTLSLKLSPTRTSSPASPRSVSLPRVPFSQSLPLPPSIESPPTNATRKSSVPVPVCICTERVGAGRRAIRIRWIVGDNRLDLLIAETELNRHKVVRHVGAVAKDQIFATAFSGRQLRAVEHDRVATADIIDDVRAIINVKAVSVAPRRAHQRVIATPAIDPIVGRVPDDCVVADLRADDFC